MATLAGGNPVKGTVTLVVPPMLDNLLGMTVQTGNSGPVLNHIDHRGEAGLNVDGTGGVMAQTAIVLVQGQNAVRTTPGIVKQRICRTKAASSMAGVARSTTGKIRSPHQYVMGRTVVLQMADKVSGMAGNTLVVTVVAQGAALQGSVCRVMTGLASVHGMNLTPGGKRCRGGGMTAHAVGGVRGRGHIHRHLWPDIVTMVMAMTVKVLSVAGRAAFSLNLARGISKAETSGIAVAGLTVQDAMRLTRGSEGRRRGTVAVQAQGNRCHHMPMLMAIEIATVTGRTGSPSGLASRVTNQ